ncbi:pyruvate kinase [Oceanicoccus sp. KOV_DT_Chl]|uniref:pyruvate kinase n=1 Tax=Oceanicoccus sp. KOV_DT_Chl TaxID=1904639 RepID=UPI000C7987FF|nr:pyruvate kinase [Oceanicoccus sp. KOV_DT_Chl]
MIRRTKIVATLGPATDKPEVLQRLIKAGVNVVRLNFSHGKAEDHILRATQVRELAAKSGRTVAILGDLQGPKIRIAQFKDGPIVLAVGDRFMLDASLEKTAGDQQQVGLDYSSLPAEVSAGDRLLLDDGRVVLQVEQVSGSKIETSVVVAGKLSNNKGINREGGGLSAGALTPKDYRDIELAATIGVDYLAVSFVRSPDDLHEAREAYQRAGGNVGIVAKIERAEAVADNTLLDDIIRASDVVMVARGDLGVEIGDAALIAVQKHLISRSRALQKVVITATQMMESMIDSPLPTRAEVFDVANAVLDGTDAVMLSGETAAGGFPVEAVEAMDRIIMGAECHPQSHVSEHRLHENFSAADESVAMAAMYTANHLTGVKAIISLTETGNTPLLMSRISSLIPIFAFTRSPKAENRVALYRGVVPVTYNIAEVPSEQVNQSVIDELLQRGEVAEGDWVIISKGDFNNVHGGTNTMKIIKVGAAVS